MENYKNDRKEQEIVFSKSVKAGKRIYYLDVKRSRNNDLFLAITESKKKFSDDDSIAPSYEKHKIFLYKEDFEKFSAAFNEIIEFINEGNRANGIYPESNMGEYAAEHRHETGDEDENSDKYNVDFDFEI